MFRKGLPVSRSALESAFSLLRISPILHQGSPLKLLQSGESWETLLFGTTQGWGLEYILLQRSFLHMGETWGAEWNVGSTTPAIAVCPGRWSDTSLSLLVRLPTGPAHCLPQALRAPCSLMWGNGVCRLACLFCKPMLSHDHLESQ